MAINYYDYIHNTSQKNAFETTDNSGIIFEFTAAIGSNKYALNPTYQMNNIGFSDVNAIIEFSKVLILLTSSVLTVVKPLFLFISFSKSCLILFNSSFIVLNIF